jgi:hypothetical protein
MFGIMLEQGCTVIDRLDSQEIDFWQLIPFFNADRSPWGGQIGSSRSIKKWLKAEVDKPRPQLVLKITYFRYFELFCSVLFKMRSKKSIFCAIFSNLDYRLIWNDHSRPKDQKNSQWVGQPRLRKIYVIVWCDGLTDDEICSFIHFQKYIFLRASFCKFQSKLTKIGS